MPAPKAKSRRNSEQRSWSCILIKSSVFRPFPSLFLKEIPEFILLRESNKNADISEISLLYEAWRVLGDPGLRRAYDDQLRSQFSFVFLQKVPFKEEARIFYEDSQYYETVSLSESGTRVERTGNWILCCVQCGDSMEIEKPTAEVLIIIDGTPLFRLRKQ